MRRLALSLALASVATASYGQSVQEILDSKALTKEYNPVVLAFTLEEGKSRLTAKQQKDALEQQLARFREEINVKPSGEVAANVATLAGMFVKGDAGAGIAEGAASVWSGWVNAAEVLQKAGYEKEVVPFFQNCIKNFPYEGLQARCAVDFAAAQPDQAIPFLAGIINDKSMPEEAKSAALRTLGVLAADTKFPKQQRDAAVTELISRTEGFMNSTLYLAAVDGLVRANDPRAVEPLRKMTKGMSKGDDVKQAAMRGLALVYKDAEGINALKGALKGGLMSDPKTQLFAAATLILADDQAGFDWAADKIAKKKSKASGMFGRLMSTDSDKVDPEPRLMAALLDNGDDKSKALLAQVADAHAPGEWIYARALTSLLLLGDTSRIDANKTIAGSDKYIPEQRADAAVALAKQKDYSGIAPVAALVSMKGTKADEKMDIAGALATIDQDACVDPLTQLLADKDENVRITAAYALADMTRPASLDGLARAMNADYGSRATAEVQAHIIRASAKKFAKDARAKPIIESGRTSKSASVRFMSAALVSKKS
jgi:HEAT repeat protein